MSTHLDAQASVSEYQSSVARLRAAMLSAMFSAEWEVGRGLTAEQSIVVGGGYRSGLDVDRHRILPIALLWAAHWMSRSASQSTLMTEANAKFKRLLT